MRDLAVIPARGGSKRIPRKNIREFCGLPMIVHAIRAAKASALFSHIVVSTDDAEIAAIATEEGAEVPFLRPLELADDFTATAPVVRHAIERCATAGWSSEYVCCIYPCVPLLQPGDLVDSRELLLASGSLFAYPVSEFAHPVQRAMRVGQRSMEFLWPEYELSRTQDLEKTYHDCGMFYWGSSAAWCSGARMHSNGVGLPVPRWRVEDIDTEEDWRRAEFLYQYLNGHCLAERSG